jgi:hypothetical protein
VTPEERSTISRLGGLTTHIVHDSHQIAARARSGLRARFEREVDPDGTLPPARRVELVDRKMRLHMTELSRRAQAARKKTT